MLATALAIAVTTAHAAIPSTKAKVEEPVLQELMGGCSLKCGFPWTVEVLVPGAGKAGPTKVLNDEKADTTWTAAPGTTGVGTKFRLSFPKKLHPEEDGQVPFYGIDFINGAWADEDAWKVQGRIKKVRLYYNGDAFRDVTLADSRRWQRVVFPDFMVRSGDSMTVEILEVYPGEKGAGAALSEIVLQGAH